MDAATAIAAFSVAAFLLTITPGLDTALVLRTAAIDGPWPAMAAGVGIAAGCLAWGLAAALGLGAVLAVSATAFTILKVAGAVYLLWLGGRMILAAFARRPTPAADEPGAPTTGVQARAAGVSVWFRRGVLTNLLNPKVGVFYVGFLPQFIPIGAPVAAFGVGLAAIHAAMGILWFAALTLLTQPAARLMRRPAVTRVLDAVTGSVLVGFGLRLALERR